MACSRVGAVLFQPAGNHFTALPNKMFEYMSAGIAVLASDFPMWRNLIEAEGAGVCVNPQDPKAIGHALAELLKDPDSLGTMGKAGQRAVEMRYNWGREEQTLLTLYDDLHRITHPAQTHKT